MEKTGSLVRSGNGPYSSGLFDEEALGMLAHPPSETGCKTQAAGFGSSLMVRACIRYVLLAVLAVFSAVAIASQISCKPVNRFLEARSEGHVKRDSQASVVSSATAAATPLVDFQVYQPVLTPTGLADQKFSADGSSQTQSLSVQPETSSCIVTLMVHDFGYSYGAPFVGKCSQ